MGKGYTEKYGFKNQFNFNKMKNDITRNVSKK